jgi:hypothetical protein
MREKVERDALPRAFGAVRLTEYEPERLGGFVNRLEQETTSFFFTNFPEEIQVVELWSLFAKEGRVSEVYIPKKRDVRGNRFGFVKFKEVKSVEALTKRLEEMWVGRYKLRINLSKFARKSSSAPTERKKFQTAPSVNKEGEPVPRPFKQALLKGKEVLSQASVATVEVGAATEFLHTLEGSFVGWLGVGVEIRALQRKLWLAGHHVIRVVEMGGGMVLIHHNAGEEVLGPMTKKGWWGGLLIDIKRWTPNLVCSKRVTWVHMHGIPLHAWGEATFRSIADRVGSFLLVDPKTKNISCLDVARVKLEVPLTSRLDYTVKLLVHGDGFWVRVLEEGGCGWPCVDGEVEDQLQVSDVGSSCGSGGQAAAMVVLEGLDGGDTNSDTSRGSKCEVPFEIQVARKSKGDKVYVRMGGEKSVVGAGDGRDIPSMKVQVKATGDQCLLTPTVTIRGSKALGNVEREGRRVQGQGESTLTPTCNLLVPFVDAGVVGPILEQVPYSSPGQLGCVGGPVVGPEPGSFSTSDPAGWANPIGPILDQERVEATAGPVITALDKMINQTRGNGGGGVTCSEFSERNSLVSSTDSQQPTIVDKGVYASTKNKKQRKTQIHFASLLGPKCLRLAGVINNNCALVNRRRTQGGIYSNSEDSNDGSAGSEGRGEKQPEVRSEEEGECVRVVGNDQDVLVEDVGDPKP